MNNSTKLSDYDQAASAPTVDGDDVFGAVYLLSPYSIPVAILIIIIIIKICKKDDSTSVHSSADEYAGSVHVVIQRDGLDAAAVSTLPIYTYAQLKGDPAVAASGACAVCLGDYKDGEMARLLPACGHVFHRSCIDPWLMIHPTCPICRRNSTAAATPLPVAQPAPVANQ